MSNYDNQDLSTLTNILQGGNFPSSIPQGETMGMMNPLGMPSLIIPKPFSLQDPSLKADLDKLKDEVMEKQEHWESRMTTFFSEYEEYTDSWRMVPRNSMNRPKQLFNSVSGETHRAVETLTSMSFRMLTAADPFYEAVADGVDDFGREASELELQIAEAARFRQLQFINFKEKLERSLRSKKLFGTMFVECPYVTKPYGEGTKYFEGTDMVHRSLLTTFFNPFVFDVREADYIGTIDFPTIYMLRNWARNDPKNWNLEKVEEIYQKSKSISSQGGSKSQTYNRVLQRKMRAGYNIMDNQAWELATYHGRIDTENDAISRYWESEGFDGEPGNSDFTIRVMQGEGTIGLNRTPFGRWQHVMKVSHEKLFEMEPLAYAVGRIGRKRQKELNATESRANDLLMFSLLNMWLVGKYAGVDVSRLTIKPWAFVEIEQMDQLQPLRPQIEALGSALGIQNAWKEDFRTSTGATTNLQAQNQGGSATESAIVQNESMRSAGVRAEIEADTFLRDFLTTSHINDTFFMDQGFHTKVYGSPNPIYVNKQNLPVNIGFVMKLVTDKDFRPDRIKNIIEALQLSTSVRNVVPAAVNVIAPLFEQLFRGLGMDTRLLHKPIPMADQMLYNMQRQQRQNQFPGAMTDNASEVGGAQAGSGAAMTKTPVGPVSTSPVQATKGFGMSA